MGIGYSSSPASRMANDAFRFRPRDVFIGDKAEGNFIGCDRNKAGFFKGRIDHFRIYRKVHDDFEALGEVPLALTQVLSKETCEKALQFADSPLSADWRRRRAAMDKELAQQPEYKNLAEEEAELNRRKSQILNTSEKLAESNEKRLVSQNLEELAEIGKRLNAIYQKR